MKKSFYTKILLRDFSFDACQSLCKPEDRKHCDKDKACHQQLCGHEQRQIAVAARVLKKNQLWGYGSLPNDKWLKVGESVEVWRKLQYKKCREITVTVEEAK